jgi:ketosteroid isomerase-like protein
MSQENVEVVKRAREAANRGDIEALLEELDPEVEWHPAMQALLGGEATVYRRHEGVREMFRDFYGAFAELHVAVSRTEDLGDRVVMIGRLRARGKESGAQIESAWGSVTEVKNGKGIRVWTYLDHEEALSAAGLKEQAMSEENVENLLQAVEAFNRKDADAFVALASPEVEWEDAMFWSGVARTYRGRDELREWFNEVEEAWESIHVEVEEITEAGDDRAFAELFLTGRGAGSGVETELRVWQVNWFVDGKTARRRVFLERAEALEAAGLSE